MMKKVFMTMVICLTIAAVGFSQTLLSENFDKAASDAKSTPLLDNAGVDLGYTMVQPTGWTITSEIDPDDTDSPGTYPSWTAMDFDGEFNTSSENRDMASGLKAGILVCDSKLWGKVNFRSWAVTPTVNITAGVILIEFDTHYRHEMNQLVRLEVSWDSKKTWQTLFQWDDVNRKSKVNYISHEKVSAMAPTGAANFTLRFFFGGDSDNNGYSENDYYWAIDNLVVTSGGTATLPATPQLTAAPSDPKGIGGVKLSGSAFAGSASHANSEWVVASDKDFANILYTVVSAKDLVSTVVPSGRTKIGMTFFAKVRYTDASGYASSFSNVVETSLQSPASLKQVEKEDFESTEDFMLPAGWKDVNFNADGGNELTTWSVKTPEEMSVDNSKANRVNLPVYEGKSCYITSDSWGGVQDDHLFSKHYNLKGYKNVWLSFWSNYMQNQDNIGVLEYSVDGGDLTADRTIKGTWLPLWYSMKAEEDIFLNADGSVDAVTTLG